MDTTKQTPEPQPMYQYKATVWVERTYTVLAQDDEGLEDAVLDAMLEEGLDPMQFPLVRMHSTRTPIPWQ